MRAFCFVNIGFSFGLAAVDPWLAILLFCVSTVGIIAASAEELR